MLNSATGLKSEFFVNLIYFMILYISIFLSLYLTYQYGDFKYTRFSLKFNILVIKTSYIKVLQSPICI